MEQTSLDDRWPILEVANDAIVNKKGDVTIALELEKPEIFTLGVAEYERLHEHWVKALRLLPAGTVVHVQDIYRKDRWKASFTQQKNTNGDLSGKPDSQSWLAAASDRFFEGRPFLRHESKVYLTRVPEGRMGVNSASSGLLSRRIVPVDTLDERLQREFEDIVQQFSQVLTDSALVRVRRISGEELVSSGRISGEEIVGAPGRAGMIEQYAWFGDEGEPVIRDVDFQDGFSIGERHAVLYSLADAELLPDSCSSGVAYSPYSLDHTKLWVGFAARLGLLLDCDHIVNHYIVIGDQTRTMARLEKKRLRLQSLSRYSRSNTVALDFVNAFLNEAVVEQRTLCRAHVNVLAWVEDKDEIRELRSKLVAALSAMGAVPHEETVGLPQLWWAGIPGNAGDLPENECFDSFLEQAVCWVGMETNYRSSGSPFSIRLGDRLTGRPVAVDLDDEPRRRGWIQNGNLFVLAGSGGGKSFFMNHLCRTYYELGMHIVVVDVGHSYRGLCDVVGGYYFNYEESRPMRFNPFYLAPGEVFDTEKKESNKALLMALWKRSDEVQYRSEYVALSAALEAYYSWIALKAERFPCFDSFYEFVRDEYREVLRLQGVKAKEFDVDNFLYVVRPYYKGGEFDFLLNATEQLELLQERFIVFELDNIKDHPTLFPVVTLVIMEVFLSKMRRLRGVRKMIVIEEAWKAIASAGMAENIRYWVKTLRKHLGKLALVSQEVEDMIDSPVIKQAIINNSDCKVLLDQSKFAGKFGDIQALLGLSEKQKAEVLSLNKAHGHGRVYKDVWIGLGPVESKVYRLEVSQEEYWTYTSDQGEKLKVEEYMKKYGSRKRAIEVLLSER